jgi:hypothetical protein
VLCYTSLIPLLYFLREMLQWYIHTLADLFIIVMIYQCTFLCVVTRNSEPGNNISEFHQTFDEQLLWTHEHTSNVRKYQQYTDRVCGRYNGDGFRLGRSCSYRL